MSRDTVPFFRDTQPEAETNREWFARMARRARITARCVFIGVALLIVLASGVLT